MIRQFCVFPILLALIQLTGCDPGGSPVDAVISDQTLRRGNGGEPFSLDPLLADDIHAFNILTDLFEGLVSVGPFGEIRPGVAEEWTVRNNGLEYIFTIRADALWSNGDPVVAEDFVRTFHLAASPATQSVYASLLGPIRGFEDAAAGAAEAEDIGVIAIDARTLSIQLDKPAPHLISVLAMPIAFPTHKKTNAESNLLNNEQPVSNGAYVLESRRPDVSTTLAKNSNYWDAHSVQIERVVYYPVADANAELNMYRAGELDITHTIAASHMQQMRTGFPAELRVTPSLALYYLAFDMTEAPFDDVNLRAALSLAIDREIIAKLIGRGEQPAYGLVPPGVANHENVSYDWRAITAVERLERARKSYALAGYGPNSPLRVKYTYDVGDPVHEKVALAVSSMWADSLGVQVELEKLEWKMFLDTRDQRSAWQVMRFSWFGDYNDPMTFADIFRSDSPQNLPQYHNSQYDSVLDEAQIQIDGEVRKMLMNRSESQLLDDYPFAPIYFYVSKHMVKPRVHGFENNILDRHPSKFLSLN